MNEYGSWEILSLSLWLRENGYHAPKANHLAHNSALVGPANPQRSLPASGIPKNYIDNNSLTPNLKNSQSAMLSPVQSAV